jgi:hypothetical protein
LGHPAFRRLPPHGSSALQSHSQYAATHKNCSDLFIISDPETGPIGRTSTFGGMSIPRFSAARLLVALHPPRLTGRSQVAFAVVGVAFLRGSGKTLVFRSNLRQHSTAGFNVLPQERLLEHLHGRFSYVHTGRRRFRPRAPVGPDRPPSPDRLSNLIHAAALFPSTSEYAAYFFPRFDTITALIK